MKKILLFFLLFIVAIPIISANFDFTFNENTAFDELLTGFRGKSSDTAEYSELAIPIGEFTFGALNNIFSIKNLVFTPEVLSKANNRNMEKYVDNLVFVALSSDHKAVFKATTLAIWNDNVGLHSYPLLVIHEQDIFSAKNFLKDNNIKKLVFVGIPEIINENNFIKDVTDSLGIIYEALDYTDYKEYNNYWINKNDKTPIISVVGVDSSNFNNMIEATRYASSLNLPLIFLDTDIKKVLFVYTNFNPNNINILLIGNSIYINKLDKDNFKLITPSDFHKAEKVYFNNFVDYSVINIPFSKKYVIYNKDIVDCSEISFIDNVKKSGFCRDNLLVPYLAVLHNQQLIGINNIILKDESNLKSFLSNKIIKSDDLYITIVGS